MATRTSTGLDAYLTDIGRFPVLTKEAQLRHCQRIHRWIHWEGGKDTAPENVQRAGRRSLSKMIETNLRLVVSLAKKYQNRGVPLDDLIQEGNIGLVRGLELYDPTRGYATSTYCYWWIRQSITRCINCTARTIRIPLHSQEMLSKIHRFRTDYRSVNGVWPPMQEVADHINSTPERIEQMLQMQQTTECTSLDAPCPNSDSTLGEVVADSAISSTYNPERYVEENTEDAKLKSALSSLTEQERTVLKGLYYSDSSQTRLSNEFGVSRSRIGAVHNLAIRKLRAQFRNTGSAGAFPETHRRRRRRRARTLPLSPAV